MRKAPGVGQRCPACRRLRHPGCRLPCRAGLDPLPCISPGTRVGRPAMGNTASPSPPPRPRKVVKEARWRGRPNRPPSPNEIRCERVVGSGSCAISRWAKGGGAGGSKSLGNEPRESRSLGGGCFFVWGELGRRDRVQVAEFEG